MQGGYIIKKDCRKIIITIGWLSAILAFGFFPAFLGIVAICMGIILKRDYEEEKHGKVLIAMGIIGGIGGWFLAFTFLR